MTDTTTVDKLKDLKPGDMITAYKSGYHRVVRVEQREYLGGPIAPLIHYLTVLSSKFKPVKSKKEHRCDLFYCRKVTLESVRLEFQKKTQELTEGHGRLIQFLQEEGVDEV